MSPDNTLTASRTRTAMIQIVVLLGLCLVLFFDECRGIVRLASRSSEASHAMVFPLLAAVLMFARRKALAGHLPRGSAWGVAMIMASLLVYFACSWPLNYALPRRWAIVPVMAGTLLTIGGWRVLKVMLPVFLILVVAIPIGTRFYARAALAPETQTLEYARAVLDLMPGVLVEQRGPDLYYFRGTTSSGTIAAGEPNRGAALFMSFLTVGLLVIFARIRPLWQVIVMLLFTGPVLLICNFVRFLVWGLLQIYGEASPLSAIPRTTSMVVSIVLAYLLFLALAGVLNNILVQPPEADARAEGAGA